MSGGEQVWTKLQAWCKGMVSITVKPRGGHPSKRFPPLTINLTDSNATVRDLKRAINNQAKIAVTRQRLTTTDKKVLEDDAVTVKSLGIADGDSLEIKDLGPQISWRTVFVIEYAGPLLIHPIFYGLQKLIYRQEFEHSRMQKLAFALVLAHFVKRECETLFIHRFSSATMPVFNLFKNSAHYWGLSGLVLAAPLYGPWYSHSKLFGTTRNDTKYLAACTAVWLYAELSNLITHLHLRSLRPEGTRERKIPTGYGFGFLSCPNYFFESIAWTAFLALTWDPAAAIFLAVAFGQMAIWAKKKHRRYKKEFGDKYPRGRKAIVPFLL